MKISDVITYLQWVQKEHGDLEIVKPVYNSPDALYPEYQTISDCSLGHETDLYGNITRTFVEVF